MRRKREGVEKGLRLGEGASQRSHCNDLTATNASIFPGLNPGFSTRIFLKERPLGSIPQAPTVDQDGLRAHLLEILGDRFLELEGAKMAFTVVLGVDGLVEPLHILYTESEEFAKVLVPELRKVYST